MLPSPSLLLLAPANNPRAPGSRGEPGIRRRSGLGPVAPVFLGFAGISAFIIHLAGGISSERLFRAVSHSFADSNHKP